MRVNLFGIGTRSESRAITAQSRVNCYVIPRKEMDRTAFALMGRPGLTSFINTLGGNPSRGLWPVNTLTTPLLFTVHAGTLYSINNAGVTSVIGVIGTTSGDVSMADDGRYLVLVDGAKGYWYNMQTPGALTQIVDGNFTTTPRTVTWQDQYFIVTSGADRQFQMSQISPGVDPAVWPANQINFTGTGAGALQGGMSDHTILNLCGPDYTEFWQNSGTADFPFSIIPGSAQQFGLAAPWSFCKFDNSLVGVFQNNEGARNISRMQGFSLRKLSDQDVDQILSRYSTVADAQGFAFMNDGHPMYLNNFPTVDTSWCYDGLANTWSQWTDLNGSRFWGQKFAKFVDRLLVSDYRNGNIYKLDPTVYTDNGSMIPVEVTSKHIWEDDKYLGISQIEVDIESGVGTVSGQGVNPVVDLQVSKDGGATFYSVGYSKMGPIGENTQRVEWRTLGAARDWVLRLRVTDPVKVVITGASAEIKGGSF